MFEAAGGRLERRGEDDVDDEAFEARYVALSDPLAAYFGRVLPEVATPGRRTVTEQLVAPAAIARKAIGLVERRAPAAVARLGRDAGAPLEPALREELEAALGAELSRVRVHRDAAAADAAAALGARAFAIGDDVYFADGAYDPDSLAGRRLIAHEVAHTLQPRSGAGVIDPGDARERDADDQAERFIAGLHFDPHGLPRPLRGRLERALGADLSRVRVHVDGLPRELGAHAVTVGDDIHFAPGAYEPATADGQRRIAHEVAHTVQNARAAIAPAATAPVSDPRDAHEVEAARFGDAFAAGGAAPVTLAAPAAVHRDDKEKEMRKTLAAAGYAAVSDADVKALVQAFPDGATIGSVEMVASMQSASLFVAQRFLLNKALSKGGGASVEIYLLPVGAGANGAGRSILIRPSGGQQFMLDAGGVEAFATGTLAALVAAGRAGGGGTIFVSHPDMDHINAANAVTQVAGAPDTIALAQQQMSNSSALRNLNYANIAAHPKIIEIELSGGPVQMHRQYRGTAEYIELRLESAQGGPRFSSNRSCPVTIVKDLSNGTTSFFTSDGQPKTIMEIANYFHPSVMSELLGTGVSAAEIPHHGGRVSKAQVVPFVQMLRMLYENSDGHTFFFTQTSPEVLEQKSASINALVAAGFPVEPVMADLSRGIADGSAVVLQNGHPVVLGNQNGELTEVQSLIQSNTSTLMRARRAQLDYTKTLTELELQRAEATGQGAADIAAALGKLHDKLSTEQGVHTSAVESYWTAMINAGRAADGMNAKFDPSGCQEALARIEALPSMSPDALKPATQTIEDGRIALDALASFKNLSESQAEAAAAGKINDVLAIRILVENARADAQKALAGEGMDEQVGAAFKAHTKDLDKLDAQSVQLGQALAQATIYVTPEGAPRVLTQPELERMAETHGWGMKEGFGGGGAKGSIARGAVKGFSIFQAIIELANTIAGLVSGILEVQRQGEIHENKTAIRDRAMLDWWMSHGAVPEIDLLDGDTSLGMNNFCNWEVLRGNDIVCTAESDNVYSPLDKPLPKVMRVVITAVPVDQQVRAAAVLLNNAKNLEAFHQDTTDKRWDMSELGQTPFQQMGEQWGTLLWNGGAYVPQVVPEVSTFLQMGFAQLMKEKQDQLDKGTPTGWQAQRVSVWVHNENDTAHVDPLATDHVNPMPQMIDLPFVGNFAYQEFKSDAEVLVASDAQTFNELRKYFWYGGKEDNPGQNPNGTVSYGDKYVPNTKGLAFVHKKDARAVIASAKGNAGPATDGPGDFPDPPPGSATG